MFVNDDIYFLSDVTENEKRKECDYLMTCFVIHVSLLTLHNCFTKRNIRFKLTDVLQLTHDSIAAVTEDDWVSSCRHVEEV